VNRRSVPSGLPPLAEPRRARILDLVNERGSIRVSELAEIVGVAEPTVRKDVADLDRHRLLRRTHGGALALRAAYEPPIAARAARNVAAKDAIARACAAEIGTGDSIFLDSGTTVQAIARGLRSLLTTPHADVRPGNVNVLTNALGVAEVLAECPGVRVSVLGGQYRVAGGCFVGPLALAAIEQFTVNLAFIAVTGLHDGSFSVADLAEAQLKRAVMEHARRVVVPMDHTKVGSSDFVKLCDLGRVDAVVTDHDDDHLRAQCAGSGARLVVAGP
jgi:DeoR/GlpR family transcriptional regulator of sugar metabolism